MSSLTYNIPAAMVGAFRGHKLIVRAKDPSELVENLLLSDIKDVAFVQLTDLNAGTEPLVGWGEGVPIDLILDEPATTFAPKTRESRQSSSSPDDHSLCHVRARKTRSPDRGI